jgi:hypothetical protein
VTWRLSGGSHGWAQGWKSFESGSRQPPFNQPSQNPPDWHQKIIKLKSKVQTSQCKRFKYRSTRSLRKTHEFFKVYSLSHSFLCPSLTIRCRMLQNPIIHDTTLHVLLLHHDEQYSIQTSKVLPTNWRRELVGIREGKQKLQPSFAAKRQKFNCTFRGVCWTCWFKDVGRLM